MAKGEGATVPFGNLPDGRAARLYVLRLPNGVSATLCDIGAALVGLECPDRDGRMGDIVLGCKSAAEHYAQNAYFGAVVGRVAGRISQARIEVDGQLLDVSRNHGPHQLHGGVLGLTRRLWDARIVEGANPAVEFSLLDPAGSEGYPGTLNVMARWTLSPPSRLVLTIEASCDAPTPFNPTVHPYFNLDGHDAGSLDTHRLTIAASHYTPIGEDLIPTGEIAPVAGTPFDLRSPSPLGTDIQRGILGFDHNFVLDRHGGPPQPAAILQSMRSGRRLSLWTGRPCLQCYTGGSLDGIAGKDGACYRALAGMCLEPQDFPDMFAHAAFPKGLLRPGMPFRSDILFEITN